MDLGFTNKRDSDALNDWNDFKRRNEEERHFSSSREEIDILIAQRDAQDKYIKWLECEVQRLNKTVEMIKMIMEQR